MNIIFDFDGTLVDSMPRLRDLGRTIIEDYFELPAGIADEMYMSTIGMSYLEQLKLLFGRSHDDDYIGRAADAFYDQQAEVYESVFLIPGVYDVIEYLNTTDTPYYGVSSTSSTMVVDVIRRLLSNFRGGCSGRDSGSKRQQLAALKSLGEAVFIGDAIHDGDTADSLGIHFVGVATTLPMIEWKVAGFTAFEDVPSAVDEVLRGPEGWVIAPASGNPSDTASEPENSTGESRGIL